MFVSYLIRSLCPWISSPLVTLEKSIWNLCDATEIKQQNKRKKPNSVKPCLLACWLLSLPPPDQSSTVFSLPLCYQPEHLLFRNLWSKVKKNVFKMSSLGEWFHKISFTFLCIIFLYWVDILDIYIFCLPSVSSSRK